MTTFKLKEIVKRNDTAERVQVVDIMPYGTQVFYRVESANGDIAFMQGSKLRPVQREGN